MATYAVTGMTCNNCRTHAEEALTALVPGASVTLVPPRAVFPGEVDEAAANAALAKAGRYRLAERIDDGATPVTPATEDLPQPSLATYKPLFLIAFYIAVAAFAGTGVIETGHLEHETPVMTWMMNAMAGFFLVFSFFKLLDIDGFATSYATYDLGAMAWKPWGYLYPFVEFWLGLASLFRIAPWWTNVAVLVVMGFSALGVIRALMKKQAIRCACLGTVLNLPMSTVTLVEDLLMVAMAGWMLAVI